jgi:hypothetical protein
MRSRYNLPQAMLCRHHLLQVRLSLRKNCARPLNRAWASAHQIGLKISDLKLVPVPHLRSHVAVLPPLHRALVRGLIAWRAALAVADVPTVVVATVTVMMIDLQTVKVVHVKMLLHMPEAIEALENERPCGTAIETERVNGTGTLAGKDMVKGTVTEKERRIEIETGRETTKIKNVIVVTGTKTVIEIETVIETVTAEMRRIVTETQGKIGNLLVVVPHLRRHLLPSILAI